AYGGVNPVDGYNAAGKVNPDGPLPRTLGAEAVGHVDGVPFIVAGHGLGSTRDGVFAEAAVVPRDALVEVPSGVDLRAAAAVGIVGLTAFSVVELGEIGPADRVVVLAGSGSVGLSAISYAASKGAQVWGQTTNAEKADAIVAMGAAQAVVSDAAGLTAAIQAFEPTAVIDSLGGEFTVAALAALAPRGRLVIFGASAGPVGTIQLLQLYRKQQRILSYGGLIATVPERRAGIAGALAALAGGRLRIHIGAELGLDEINEAFALVAGRKVTGKVILKLR
ncbi:MAG TPA: zinc-binding alcohol dehydrogenase family protein, partial [Acidothermaceae bacterium]|nr:zinc-binding alcohol dehydrogenase family protein [Acidothermaceae bacterium]